MEKVNNFLGLNIDFFGGIALIGGAIATALGGFDTMLFVLLMFMVLDYMTGIINALVFKKSPKSETGALESRACLKGLFRKGGILLVVFIAVELDAITNQHFIRNMVTIGFVASEGISILENVGYMGVPIPAIIANTLDALKKKSEAESKKENE